MKLSKQIWDQLKAKTCDELIAALKRDGFAHEETRGAAQGYCHEDGRRITIHYYPDSGYGPKLLKGLIGGIGWSEADMRRLKLIK